METSTLNKLSVEILQQENDNLKEKVSNQTKYIKILEEKIRMDKIARFAKRSEKFEDSNQLSLFDEYQEELPKEQVDEVNTEITVPEHQRKKKGRKNYPNHFHGLIKYMTLIKVKNNVLVVALEAISAMMFLSNWILSPPRYKLFAISNENMLANNVKVL